VIVIDANLLLYAYSAPSPKQEKALAWLEAAISHGELVGLPWQVISAFLRIASNPKLPQLRRPVQEVARIVDAWLQEPNVRVLVPGDNHWSIFRQLILEGQASGDLVSDAQVAALTIECGGVLYTTDRDFARFPGLRWENPLG
jgi:toxin-antitoxin system PIN domain toxin